MRSENLDPKGGSASHYFTVMVKGESGIETLVITEGEMERIRRRAAKNPEDTTMVPSLWDKALSAWV
jgi:hypothetical protein